MQILCIQFNNILSSRLVYNCNKKDNIAAQVTLGKCIKMDMEVNRKGWLYCLIHTKIIPFLYIII